MYHGIGCILMDPSPWRGGAELEVGRGEDFTCPLPAMYLSQEGRATNACERGRVNTV